MDSVIRLAAQYWHLAIVGTLLALLSLGVDSSVNLSQFAVEF